MEKIKSYISSFSIKVIHNGSHVAKETFQCSKIKIGRSTFCDICLNHFSYISRHHLTVFLKKESVVVVDENSKLGVSYLGEKISSVEIESHGIFEVSDISIQVIFHPAQVRHEFNNNKIKSLEKTVTYLMQMGAQAKNFKEKEDHSSDASLIPYEQQKNSIIRQMFKGSYFLKNQFFKYFYNPQKNADFFSVSPSLRASLVWRGQILNSHIFNDNEYISVTGYDDGKALFVPDINIPEAEIGYVTSGRAHICVTYGTMMCISKDQSEPSFKIFEPNMGFKGEIEGAESNMFELSLSDHCLIFLNENLGIAYEFVDTYEKIPCAVLRKEDHDFIISIRNVVASTLIIMAVLAIIGDSQIKSKDKASKKERIVEVIIPEKKNPPPPKPPEPLKPKPIVQRVKPRPVKSPRKTFKRPKKVVLPRSPVRLRAKSKSKAVSSPKKVQRPTNNALAAFAQFNSLNTLHLGKTTSNFKINSKKSQNQRMNGGKNLISSLNQISNSPSNSKKSSLNNISTDFSSKNLSRKTGKRGVKGAPVGPPKLLNSPNRTQGLKSSQVMAVVNKYLSEVQRCYERALFSQPQLAGRVEYEWTISPRGKVKSVSVRRSEMSGDQSLNRCVKKIFARMRFPSSTNGQTTISSIGFPFGKL